MTPIEFEHFCEGLKVLSKYDVQVHADEEYKNAPAVGVSTAEQVRTFDESELTKLGWYRAWDHNGEPYSERWDFNVDQWRPST